MRNNNQNRLQKNNLAGQKAKLSEGGCAGASPFPAEFVGNQRGEQRGGEGLEGDNNNPESQPNGNNGKMSGDSEGRRQNQGTVPNGASLVTLRGNLAASPKVSNSTVGEKTQKKWTR